VWNFLGSRYLAFRHTALKGASSVEDDTGETYSAASAVEKEATTEALETDDNA
jgi:hypothetical protein